MLERQKHVNIIVSIMSDACNGSLRAKKLYEGDHLRQSFLTDSPVPVVLPERTNTQECLRYDSGSPETLLI
jgi:hypothetical protein